MATHSSTLPLESPGQRSLAGYCLRVRKVRNDLVIEPRWDSGKESSGQCRRPKRLEFNPWVRKIPWSRKWQPTPVFLPGKFHGQRNLAGSSSQNQTQPSNLSSTYTAVFPVPVGGSHLPGKQPQASPPF